MTTDRNQRNEIRHSGDVAGERSDPVSRRERRFRQDHHVVIVSRSDRFPAATRVFWALDLLGHKKVSVLDGGIDKWIAEKRPMTSETPHFAKTSYKVDLKRDRLMTGDELAGYVGSFKELGIVAVDSRRPEEHAGTKMSRASSKLGRIPGAVSLFFPAILVGDSYKEFKSANEIKSDIRVEGHHSGQECRLLLRERLFRDGSLSWGAVA